jgi:hypothetical protein
LLTNLPAGTIAAVEVSNPGSIVDAATGLLRGIGSAFAGGIGTGSCASTLAIPGPPDSVIPPGTPHRRALLRQLQRSRRQLRRQLQRQNDAGPCPATPTPLPDPLAQFKTATGLTLPGDVKTLLGDGAVVAFGGLQIGSLPDVAIRSHPSDLTAATDLGGVLKQTLAGSAGVDISVEPAGSDLVLATSNGYAGEIAKDGALGDQSRAATALEGIPAQVTSAGYVDLSRVWPLAGASGSTVSADVQHLKALGFWSDVTGDVQHFQLRLLAG